MNTADGTDRKKKLIERMEYNIVLGYFLMSQQNTSVQIVNFSSFPLKSGGEKNTFSIIKYVVFCLLFLT